MARLALVPVVLALAACSSTAIVQQGPSDTLRTYSAALQDGRVDDAYRLLSDEAKRGMSLEAFRRAVKENPQDAAEIAQALARPTTDPVVTAHVTLPSGDELLLVYEGGRWRIDASAVELYGQATPRQALVGFLRAFERKRYDVVLRYVPDAERQGMVPPGEEIGAEPAPRADATRPAPAPAAGAKDAARPDAKDVAKPGADAKDAAKPDAKDAAKPDARDAAKPDAAARASGELTAEDIRVAWEGPQKDHINRIVQAIKTALPTAQIEETGDSAAMSYGAGGTVAFVREHGAWKIRDL
jgi:pyruvate/2-oxoglutarate dehydrogenase complex dihydrolipoamide acyltransferase (E2) component